MVMRGGSRVALFAGTAALLTGVLTAAPGHAVVAGPPGWVAQPPLQPRVVGTTPDGAPQFTSANPTGLPPAAVNGVYSLSPISTSGGGQIIAIVDAYHDPNALADLNKFSGQYGLGTLSACTSLSQSGPCFQQADPNGTPTVNSGWVLEESLDIEWAHAEAPAAKIVLVEAASNSLANLFKAVTYANGIGATEVSMSWDGGEFSGETTYDGDFTHSGTLYTVSSGDTGGAREYPAASPNVIAVGGTTLNGCHGTSCAGSTSETGWSGSGGGVSAYEQRPAYQTTYGLTASDRSIPDVSFEADPNTGVSVYDSTRYQGQSGWWTLGGTSVGAPSWAGILAAGAAAGRTTLQGDPAIYATPSSNLRDVTSGSAGSNTAGPGYDLVTGLGSPVSYP